MSDLAERIPVIVGVGQVNDRPADPAAGLDPVALMAQALRAADHDGGNGWLGRIDSLAVVDQISFPELNPVVSALADGLGIAPTGQRQTDKPMGDSPILLLSDAANAIAAGTSRVAAVVGAEALRTAARLARARSGGPPPDPVRDARHRQRPPYRSRYGLIAPVDIYPLYENALRAAWGQSLAEAQAESAEIWARMSRVAAENPSAWLREPRTADDILAVSADNRPIAFPYTKLMVANSSVNQGAGFIVASLAAARAAGIPENRLIYIGRGAAAHEPEDILERENYHRSAGMEVSLTRALALNGVTIDAIDHAELYSCFPCVPKLARRIVGWPLEKPATVFGGLTFGGGPIGNYMSHAVVAMVEALRRDGTYGLLFANGGYATHNHTIVVSRRPFAAGHSPHDYDCQAEADAMRGSAPPLDEGYVGPGVIESYTVLYDRAGAPRFAPIVARNPAGARFLAKLPGDDAKGIAFLTDGQSEPVGSSGDALRDAASGDLIWRFRQA